MSPFLFLFRELLGSIRARTALYFLLTGLLLFAFLAVVGTFFLLPSPSAGRGNPRWSVVGQPDADPASRAGLAAPSAAVGVVPLDHEWAPSPGRCRRQREHDLPVRARPVGIEPEEEPPHPAERNVGHHARAVARRLDPDREPAERRVGVP